jgi:hypothetical protein
VGSARLGAGCKLTDWYLERNLMQLLEQFLEVIVCRTQQLTFHNFVAHKVHEQVNLLFGKMAVVLVLEGHAALTVQESDFAKAVEGVSFVDMPHACAPVGLTVLGGAILHVCVSATNICAK